MRPIKYRAYLKNEKMMLPVIMLDYDYRGEGKLVYVDTINPSGDVEADPWENRIEDVELMQFTGLHDTDDVEIYEDDILQLKQTLPQIGGGTKTFISWYLITFGFYDNYRGYDENEVGYGWYLHKIRENNQKKDSISGIYDDEMFKHMTVIGNVYEHPELLKDVTP